MLLKLALPLMLYSLFIFIYLVLATAAPLKQTQTLVNDDKCSRFSEFQGSWNTKQMLFHPARPTSISDILDHGISRFDLASGVFSTAVGRNGGGAFYAFASKSSARQTAPEDEMLGLTLFASARVLLLDVQPNIPSVNQTSESHSPIEMRKLELWTELATYYNNTAADQEPHPTSTCFDVIVGPAIAHELGSSGTGGAPVPSGDGIMRYAISPSGISVIDRIINFGSA